MHTIKLVEQFHRTFAHPIAYEPTVPPDARRLLRFKLIFEELMEFGRAIGMSNLCDLSDEEFERSLQETLAGFTIVPDFDVDLEGAADALADLDYVVQGSNLEFGFPAEAIGAEVHNANMSKLGEDGKPIHDPETGKIVKGPNTRLPNLAPILDRATKHGSASVEAILERSPDE